MNSELRRIESFKVRAHQFHQAWSCIRDLATYGFYFDGTEIRCFSCGVSYNKWSMEDDVVQVHKKISPNCHFITRRKTDNIPLDSVVLPDAPVSDVCGLSENLETLNLDDGDMSLECNRLQTYCMWSPYIPVKPDDLSAAGFFYTGIGDCVQCFSCNVQIQSWELDDDPIEEHKKWSSGCSFLIEV